MKKIESSILIGQLGLMSGEWPPNAEVGRIRTLLTRFFHSFQHHCISMQFCILALKIYFGPYLFPWPLGAAEPVIKCVWNTSTRKFFLWLYNGSLRAILSVYTLETKIADRNCLSHDHFLSRKSTILICSLGKRRYFPLTIEMVYSNSHQTPSASYPTVWLEQWQNRKSYW